MIMHNHHHQQQQHTQQFLTTSPNNWPHNEDSTTPPTDGSTGSNLNSMSTATPPHSGQICRMRVSPASSNNINNIQPVPNNGATGSASNTKGHNHNHNHRHHHHHHHSGISNAGISSGHGQMVRQFACHAKSMSAGVVVSVPGISNNFASAIGMSQNNLINNHIVSSHTKQHPHMTSNGATAVAGMPLHHHQFVHHQNSGSHLTVSSDHKSHHHIDQLSTTNGGQQPPIVLSRSDHRERDHHRQQLSQQPYPSSHQQAATMLHETMALKGPEFLPICDLMFNLISMILYFCENTFGIIALIALYYHSSNQYWALVGAFFVACSNTVSQYLSFKWLFKSKLDDCKRKREAQEELETEGDCERRYFNRTSTNISDYPYGSCAWLPDSATEVQLKFLISITIDAVLHLFCLGFLVRYIKLVIPVKDTARVRKEARDLCMLRMVHGFIQSAPLWLLQAYMICSGGAGAATPILSLSVTSATLSLLNLCWALASFTKYARKKYLQRKKQSQQLREILSVSKIWSSL